MGAGGGGDEEIDMFPDGVGLLLAGLEFVVGVEYIDGGGLYPFFDEGPGGGEEGIGRFFDEVLDGPVAFGYPGALVEEMTGGEHGLDVDDFADETEGLEAFDGLKKESLVFFVAEEFELEGAGYSEGHAFAVSTAGIGEVLGDFAGVGICGVVGGGDVVGGLGVGGVEGEDGDAVEGLAGGDEAGGAEGTSAGFEADEVIKAGGDAAGAGGICAEGEGYLSEGDGYGGARAGTAGNVVGVEGVAGDSVGSVGTCEAGGKLVEVGLADGDGSGGAELGDDGGVFGGKVFIVGAGGCGGEVVDVDVVVYGEGDAVEGE